MSEGQRQAVLLARGATVAGYKIRDKLHEGPGGAVYSAVHPMTGVKATVRVVQSEVARSDEAFDVFAAGTGRLACLDHPGVVRLRAAGRLDAERVYAVYEFALGQTLAEVVDRNAPMGLLEAAPLVESLAATLSAAHQQGFAHGSLSLANVHATPPADGGWPPVLRVGDLGLSPLLAPAAGGSVLDDVRALGGLAHALLTGELVSGTAPAGAEAFVLQALEQDPQRRTQSMEQLIQGLRQAVAAAEAAPPQAKSQQTEPDQAQSNGVEPEVESNREQSEVAASAANGSEAAAGDAQTSSDAAGEPSDGEGAGSAGAGRGGLAVVRTAEIVRTDRGDDARRTVLVWGLLWLAIVGIGAGVAFRLVAGRWPLAGAPERQLAGTIELDSEPAGATVVVDKVPWRDRTPTTIPVVRGRHYDLSMHLVGHESWRQRVALGLQEPSRQLSVPLARAVSWGTLQISVDRKADVFLDSRRVGTQTQSVNLAEVRADVDHRIKVRAPGFRAEIRQVRVPAGKVRVLRFALRRVDTSPSPK